MHSLLHLLLVTPSMKVSELFLKAKNKLEVVVTFLAVLELIRMKEAIIFQKEKFAEIEISRNKDNILPYERRDEGNQADQAGTDQG